ncbi:MAG: geranylgeranylglyceryl/heptaprenylglyceryl phosphate synthase, partial [Bacteroidia bacterium]|nr:geranylgeranylglyceryl/heptaprenylglyceryl phosphate synthase [Bacteroidia bacterium]
MAVLLDPDKIDQATLPDKLHLAEMAGVSIFLVGGSLLVEGSMRESVRLIKTITQKPVILFPGHAIQIAPEADAILFLSLISGRNPELLIGQHVIAAPLLRRSSLEVIPTGYLLIDGGSPTAATYISNTLPIPADKPEIAACTAMAGELLGLQCMYLDAGSGARNSIRSEMIQAVRQAVQTPIFVGGGIRTPDEAARLFQAGADVVVIGNA